MKRAVLFDLDGTLLDTLGDLQTAINATRACYGQGPLQRETVQRYIGEGMRHLVECALAGVPHDAEEALQMQIAHYAQHRLETSRPYPGATEGLKVLHDAGWKLGVVTNKPLEAAEAVLRGTGLLPLLDAVSGGGSIPLKPDPAGCLALLRQLDVLPEHAVMAGDHYTDLEAGRRAGMKRIWVQWGYGDPRKETWDHASPDFPELTAWLLSLEEKENG